MHDDEIRKRDDKQHLKLDTTTSQNKEETAKL